MASYGNDEQRSQAEKDAISCLVMAADWYKTSLFIPL